jgi:hypothetical protein
LFSDKVQQQIEGAVVNLTHDYRKRRCIRVIAARLHLDGLPARRRFTRRLRLVKILTRRFRIPSRHACTGGPSRIVRWVQIGNFFGHSIHFFFGIRQSHPQLRRFTALFRP